MRPFPDAKAPLGKPQNTDVGLGGAVLANIDEFAFQHDSRYQYYGFNYTEVGDTPQLLSSQGGAKVIRQGDVVIKEGTRVKPNEEAALRLVQRSTKVPVPEVHDSSYTKEVDEQQRSVERGRIRMSAVDGEMLDDLWDAIEDDKIKERICRHTWELIYCFRQIPKPVEFEHYFQCGADGTASCDVLIQALPGGSTDPLSSDEELRQRIYKRYLHYCGRRYEKELPEMLPRSEKSVFTHGDIAPRNIMITDDYQNPVKAVIDWDSAGWYPEWWEYANLLKPSKDDDWQRWMKYTAPEEWDISGIVAARRVLF